MIFFAIQDNVSYKKNNDYEQFRSYSNAHLCHYEDNIDDGGRLEHDLYLDVTGNKNLSSKLLDVPGPGRDDNDNDYKY